MIILWFYQFLVFLKKLVIPPPEELFIDINEQCPCCGHKSGKLTSVLIDGNLRVEHSCLIDGAHWYSEPVMKDAHKYVHPTIVRN